MTEFGRRVGEDEKKNEHFGSRPLCGHLSSDSSFGDCSFLLNQRTFCDSPWELCSWDWLIELIVKGQGADGTSTWGCLSEVALLGLKGSVNWRLCDIGVFGLKFGFEKGILECSNRFQVRVCLKRWMVEGEKKKKKNSLPPRYEEQTPKEHYLLSSPGKASLKTQSSCRI